MRLICFVRRCDYVEIHVQLILVLLARMSGIVLLRYGTLLNPGFANGEITTAISNRTIGWLEL